MKKSLYFILQIVWSLVFSIVIWYLALKNSDYDFYGNSGSALVGVIIAIGGVIYLILTLVYIFFGVKKVKEWHRWVIFVSLAIAGVIAFVGIPIVAFGTEFLNRMLSLNL